MKPEAREALAGKIKLSLEVEAEQAYGLRKQKAPKRRFHELWCGNCKMSNHNTEDCFRKKYRPDRSFVETLVDRLAPPRPDEQAQRGRRGPKY